MKIGLISDTHSAGNGTDLPAAVLESLQGVDLILHCGDLECLGVLDYLERVAPVLAVRGYEDPTEPGGRLAECTRVVQAEDLSIGMVHDIQWPSPRIGTSGDGASLQFPAGSSKATLAAKFRQPVDIVVFGDTHEELVCLFDGVLLINPGSPTYPGRRHRPGTLGTIGLLEVQGRTATISLVDLEDREQGR